MSQLDRAVQLAVVHTIGVSLDAFLNGDKGRFEEIRSTLHAAFGGPIPQVSTDEETDRLIESVFLAYCRIEKDIEKLDFIVQSSQGGKYVSLERWSKARDVVRSFKNAKFECTQW